MYTFNYIQRLDFVVLPPFSAARLIFVFPEMLFFNGGVFKFCGCSHFFIASFVTTLCVASRSLIIYNN